MSVLRFDPSKLPVDSVAPGEAVPEERMTPEAIRSRFENPPEWTPEVRTEPAFVVRDRRITAAVLVPLVVRDEGLSVLLTQRALHLADHPGQISFPGGRMDETDESCVATALRELEEEVGIGSEHTDVLGQMPVYRTGSGFDVTPVVSFLKPPFKLVLNPEEVADAFEVPFSHFMTGTNYQMRSAEFPNRQGRRSFFTVPYRNRFVWGATAAMLRNLYHFLKA